MQILLQNYFVINTTQFIIWLNFCFTSTLCLYTKKSYSSQWDHGEIQHTIPHSCVTGGVKESELGKSRIFQRHCQFSFFWVSNKEVCMSFLINNLNRPEFAAKLDFFLSFKLQVIKVSSFLEYFIRISCLFSLFLLFLGMVLEFQHLHLKNSN